MKKAFPFYRSYYEQIQYLKDKQIAILVVTICRVQFLELHINDVKLEDKMSQLAWAGIKHSIQKSLDGYCAKMNIDYDETLSKGLGKGLANKRKGKIEVEDKVEVEDKEEVKIEKKSSPTNNIEIETDASKVAKHLHKKILEKKPNFREPNLKNWEKDIEQAMNQDNRKVQELIACIDWIYSDTQGNFWIPNILNAKKLREKFDVMESQMINQPKNKSRNKIAQILSEGGY